MYELIQQVVRKHTVCCTKQYNFYMEQRINQHELLNHIGIWNDYLKKRVSLIACGGTAMTLLGVKDSTKDIDLIVPVIEEYNYLIGILEQIGYKSVSGVGWSREGGFIFDIFRGKSIHTTELLESPLDSKNHILVKEFSYVYFGVLNYYDIIISKLFRGTTVDIDDCISLVEAKREEIDLALLEKRYKETASYETAEERVNKNLESFLRKLKR